MRARNELERLSEAGRPLLADADSLVDDGERDRILTRILASPRSTARRRIPRRRLPLAIVGAAALAAAVAVVSTGAFRRPSSTGPTASGHHHSVALSGTRLELAGYHFRTPAGYTSSDTCPLPATSTPGSPDTVVQSMQAAASADGGCVRVAILDRSWTVPPEAQPIGVGAYDGFLVAPQNIPEETLFVQIPAAQGVRYLVVAGQGLSVAQLVAIAESGLPAAPAG
ncbi:MAG TPA: hypothetical protein VLW49_10830 [Gaiellaceae bacterium]|nr:hypothetical protein [Gaiellaceae bacterium]